MSIDYELRVSPGLPEAKALDYFAGLLGLDTRDTDRRAGRDDLRTTVGKDTADEDPEMAELLGGVDQILVVIFHPSKFLDDHQDAQLFAELIGAAAQYFEDYPQSKGTFTFQNEIIYLQRLGDDGIVLDQRLREADHNRYGVLDDLLTRYTVRPIEQIFLY